jgi:fatty acid/phospholipid biosynthesis enzyme
MAKSIESMIKETFTAVADGLCDGSIGVKPKIAITGMGSEHGEENSMAGAVEAARAGVDVYYIGTLEHPEVTTIKVKDDEEGHDKMEAMLDSGELDGAVTMHFPFPIGVSTVGRCITPAYGKEMYLATTTGTSSTDNIEGMVLNAIYGIITAKACGVEKPTVGIVNVNGARQCEKTLKQLQEGGYDIKFADSARADGGCVMRGNDVLQGSADVMVCDSLTGNVLSKITSSYTTGGSFEALGYGYGPGIGEGYKKLVMIVSRASGAPVIANAIKYAAQLVRGNVFKVAEKEIQKANNAGLKAIRDEIKAASAKSSEGSGETVTAPPAEPTTSQIPGIEVLDLEDAQQSLWKEGIYAESGMGCTGPIIKVSDANLEKAQEILKKAGYIQ